MPIKITLEADDSSSLAFSEELQDALLDEGIDVQVKPTSLLAAKSINPIEVVIELGNLFIELASLYAVEKMVLDPLWERLNKKLEAFSRKQEKIQSVNILIRLTDDPKPLVIKSLPLLYIDDIVNFMGKVENATRLIYQSGKLPQVDEIRIVNTEDGLRVLCLSNKGKPIYAIQDSELVSPTNDDMFFGDTDEISDVDKWKRLQILKSDLYRQALSRYKQR